MPPGISTVSESLKERLDFLTSLDDMESCPGESVQVAHIVDEFPTRALITLVRDVLPVLIDHVMHLLFPFGSHRPFSPGPQVQYGGTGRK